MKRMVGMRRPSVGAMVRGSVSHLGGVFAHVAAFIACLVALGCGEDHSVDPENQEIDVLDASDRNWFSHVSIDVRDGFSGSPTNQIASVDPLPGFQIQLVFDASELIDDRTRQIVRAAADRWEHVITADVPDIEVSGQLSCNGHVAPAFIDDVVVVVGIPYIDGVENRLGIGAPCAARQTPPAVPAFGVLELDVSDLGNDERALAVATHELGHVLGFGALWDRAGLLQPEPTQSGDGAMFFVGSAGFEAFEAAGGRGFGIPVELEGGAESAFGHWDEHTFGSELMTPRLEHGSLPLSAVSVASLADLGYEVDATQADVFSFEGD